jgi:hypothetical protein
MIAISDMGPFILFRYISQKVTHFSSINSERSGSMPYGAMISKEAFARDLLFEIP